jgi:O-methyltransferase involved in polyketide biosynthesis
MKRLTASGYAQKRAAGDFGFIVARCRYMDVVLSEELDRGIQQLVILGAGYDSRAYRFDQLKTLFIWEGVKMYLDASSVDSILAFVASHSAPGSAIVFDYLCKPPAVPKRDIGILLVSSVRSFFNEARRFKIEADQIEPFLTYRGFSQVHNATTADLRRRYFTGRNAGRKVTSDYAIAIGVV